MGLRGNSPGSWKKKELSTKINLAHNLHTNL